MTKGKVKTKKTDKTNNTANTDEDIKQVEEQIKALVQKGKRRKYITYEEMNKELPEGLVSPVRLDKLLAKFDEMGIKLLDEAEVEDEEDFEADEDQEQLDEDKLLEKKLKGESVSSRIDDPIRMYLTQMGEIPLLSREEEITLARKIELARMSFRRKMLQSDYCASNAVDIMQRVYQKENAPVRLLCFQCRRYYAESVRRNDFL